MTEHGSGWMGRAKKAVLAYSGGMIGGDALDRLREKQLSDLCGVPDRNGSDRARSNGAHGTLLR